MRKYLLLLSLTTVFISYGYGQQFIEVVKTYKNGNIKSISYHKKVDNKIKMTKREFYFRNGQIEQLENFEDSLKAGVYKEWHENGQIQLQGKFKNGQKEGIWTYWNDRGQKGYEGKFRNGQEEGLHTKWDNGVKYEEISYIKGERQYSKSEMESINASEARTVMSNINNASKMFYQTKGQWPSEIVELERTGHLDVSRSTKLKWTFDLQISDQGGYITATSTEEMSGGAGHQVVYDVYLRKFTGYGSPGGD